MTFILRGFVALATVSILLASAPADARAKRRAVPVSAYDGAWHLSFVTRAGGCDPSYEFDVNIMRGVITHPNLVRFRGAVSRGGAARASVAVGDKSASGAGRLSLADGRGSWSGYAGGSRCSGHWVARKI